MSSPHDAEKFENVNLHENLPLPAAAKNPPHRNDSEFPLRPSQDTGKAIMEVKKSSKFLWGLMEKETFIHIITRIFLFFVNTFLVTLLVMTQMYDSESPMTSPIKWLYYTTLVLSGYTLLNGLVYISLYSAWLVMARFWILLEFGWVLATCFSVACAGMFISTEAKLRDEAYRIAHPNADVLAIGIVILAVFQLILCLYTLCITCINYEQFQKTKIMELPVYCNGPNPNHPYGPWAQQPTILSRQDQTASPLPAPEPVAIRDEKEYVQPTVTVRCVDDAELTDKSSRPSSDYSEEYDDDIVVASHDGHPLHKPSMADMSSPGRRDESNSMEALRATAGCAFINSTTNMSKTTLETVMEVQRM